MRTSTRTAWPNDADLTFRSEKEWKDTSIRTLEWSVCETGIRNLFWRLRDGTESSSLLLPDASCTNHQVPFDFPEGIRIAHVIAYHRADLLRGMTFVDAFDRTILDLDPNFFTGLSTVVLQRHDLDVDESLVGFYQEEMVDGAKDFGIITLKPSN